MNAVLEPAPALNQGEGGAPTPERGGGSLTLASEGGVPVRAHGLRAPWRDASDGALLAHFRGGRGVRFDPVIDAAEIMPMRLDGVMRGAFEFNGETHALVEPIDWLTNPSRDVEWHILLHKFYYAVGLAQRWQRHGDAAAFARWARLIDGWIRRDVPPGFIAADVTGRRVQNWIYSLHGVLLATARPAPFEALGAHGVAPGFLHRLLASIESQVTFLCANLTPKRNHRTIELLAIFLAGVVFPEFERADAWRDFALRETLVNVEADLLPDGVHCELSTDYHHLALRNWLQVRRLASANGHPVPAALDAALERALRFSLHVHQPSGACPSFSDGDVRSFLPLLAEGAELYNRDDMRFVASQGRAGRAPAERVAHFDAAGYHVVRGDWSSRDAQHLVFDCGPLGEGNHGHFDALSFELAAFGEALVVDPARYTYSEDATRDGVNWRVHFRGTAAHNTVCVDGRPQTRYEPRPIKDPASRHTPGSVRHKIAGAAPVTTLVERCESESIDLLHGRCVSQAYDAVHERCIVFVDRRYWIVSDWLRAPKFHSYTLNFQLQSQPTPTLHQDATGVRLDARHLVLMQPRRRGHAALLEEGWVSSLYGHKDAAPALRTRVRATDAEFDTVLWPTRAPAAAVELGVSEQTLIDDTGRSLRALCVHTDEGTDGWFHARGATGTWVFRGGALDGWRFTGRWLHWRVAPDGRVRRVLSHHGAGLETCGAALATVDR